MLAWKTSSPHPTCLEAQKMIGLCCQIALIYSAKSLSALAAVAFKNMSLITLCLLGLKRIYLPFLFFSWIRSNCVFFFFSSNEGVWSSEGCVRSGGNMTYSVCLCNHLTNFAILMQVVPLEVWNLGFSFNLPLLILPIAPMEFSSQCFSDCIRITHCSPQCIRP